MMEQIQLWQMLVDVSLVGAVLFIAVRWMKSSQAQALLPRTMELEGSLRALIKEADAAGRHLNDQLLRREQNLQKLLSDVEEGEQRLTRYIADGEERTKSVQLSVEMARDIISDLQECIRQARGALDRALMERRQWETTQSEPAPREQRSHEPRRSREVRESQPLMPSRGYADESYAARRATRFNEVEREEYFLDENDVNEAVTPQREVTRRAVMPEHVDRERIRSQRPQPRSHEEASSARQSERSSAQRYPQQQMQQSARSVPPIPQPEPGHPEMRSQKQLSQDKPGEARGMHELQHIYATAEDMIKQGQELEQVCAQTKLPAEEVRLLSQMIEVERDEEERKKRSRVPAGADPRLGALGAIRRQTTTV